VINNIQELNLNFLSGTFFAYFLKKSFNRFYMKTSFYKLEYTFLSIVFLLVSFKSYSQDEKFTRQEKKAAKKEQEYANFQVLGLMIKNKSFVLEANFLENRYGTRIPVMSNINFIMVDSLKVVLQTGNDSRMGYNGVGGVTAEGKISNIKVTTNQKSLSYFLRFTVSTPIGFYDVSMNIYSTNYARAEITGLSAGKLIYDGQIQTLYNSRVYKGRGII
jgi:hypothetical protein